MSSATETYDLSLLEKSAAKWNASRALRIVYADIFAEMRGHLIEGPTLELGAGIAVTRKYFTDLVTSDIRATRFVDRRVSAYDIPRESWANIMATDTLHHLEKPLLFFESAARALRPRGRIVLAEPAGTFWGKIFYRLFHHEPCDLEAVQFPFEFAAAADGSFANMGIAQALFGREREKMQQTLQKLGLGVVSVSYRDFMAYPATGGFSGRALLPASTLSLLLKMEQLLPQSILRLLALRMVVVLERIT